MAKKERQLETDDLIEQRLPLSRIWVHGDQAESHYVHGLRKWRDFRELIKAHVCTKERISHINTHHVILIISFIYLCLIYILALCCFFSFIVNLHGFVWTHQLINTSSIVVLLLFVDRFCSKACYREPFEESIC